MPRRPDAHLAYWYDYEAPVFRGYPRDDEVKRERTPTKKKDPSVAKSRRQALLAREIPLDARVEVEDFVGYRRPLNPDVEPRIILVSRDRQGFRWEREVGLSDYVSLGDAAQLLGVPLMRVHRWVGKRLRTKKLRGYSVVRVSQLYRLALELNLSVPHGRQMTTIREPAPDDDGEIKDAGNT